MSAKKTLKKTPLKKSPRKKPTELKVIYDEPYEEYHEYRDNYFTAGNYADYKKDPALFYHNWHKGETEDTDALRFGRAVHTGVLEGRKKLLDEYMIHNGPINERTGNPYGKATKAYSEWLDKQSKPVISTVDYEMISSYCDIVESSGGVSDLFRRHKSREVTIRGRIDNVNVQIRIDAFEDRDPLSSSVIDLKTIRNIEKIEDHIVGYQYDLKAYFYKWVSSYALEAIPHFNWLFVEKEAPYRVSYVRNSDGRNHSLNFEKDLKDMQKMATSIESPHSIYINSRFDGYGIHYPQNEREQWK